MGLTQAHPFTAVSMGLGAVERYRVLTTAFKGDQVVN